MGTKVGVGVRHALFPGPALGASMGCRLPDAILRGKRSCRPRSRAVQRLAAAGFWVRPLSPVRLVVAATGLRTRSRNVCDLICASGPISAGTATAIGGALAPCHGSDLLPLRLPLAHRPAVPFVGSPASWKELQALPRLGPSRFGRSLCPAFRRL
jgi:hypothetical protein